MVLFRNGGRTEDELDRIDDLALSEQTLFEARNDLLSAASADLIGWRVGGGQDGVAVAPELKSIEASDEKVLRYLQTMGRRDLEVGDAELIVAAHDGVGKAIRLEVNVQYRLRRCKAAIGAAQHFERGAVTYDCKLIANPLHTIDDGGPRQLRGQKEDATSAEFDQVSRKEPTASQVVLPYGTNVAAAPRRTFLEQHDRAMKRCKNAQDFVPLRGAAPTA